MNRAALGIAAAWLALIWLWPPAPLALTVDDSFYYFGIANHVARGDGFSFDGVEPTTGFHPLWLLALVPFARFVHAAPDFGVRAVLGAQVLLVSFGVWRLARKRPAIVALFAICALNFHFTKIFVNGLESALEFVLLVLAVEAAEDERDFRLGALGAALTLARLSAFPAAAVLLFAKRRPPAAYLAFVAPIGVYVLVLTVTTGHAFPINGAVKFGHTPLFTPLSLTATLGAVGTSVAAVRYRGPAWLAPLVVWIGVQLACDSLLRYRLVPEVWYFVPHATLFVLVAAEVVRRWPRLRFAALAVIPLSIPLWRERLQPESYGFYLQAKRAGEWLAANTPPDAHVAGWDAGIAAFYSQRAFTNLDGLAASWDYVTRYQRHNRFRAYFDDRRIDWIAQEMPAGQTLEKFHGLVDLRDWTVVYDQPFVFRGITNWGDGPSPRRYVILRRN